MNNDYKTTLLSAWTVSDAIGGLLVGAAYGMATLLDTKTGVPCHRGGNISFFLSDDYVSMASSFFHLSCILLLYILSPVLLNTHVSACFPPAVLGCIWPAVIGRCLHCLCLSLLFICTVTACRCIGCRGTACRHKTKRDCTGIWLSM